jgi:hypothetical protein
MNGIEAAKKFLEKYHPDCLAAALCGSVARGDATPTSDLDILIIDRKEIPFQRKTFEDFGWTIEAFVGSQEFNNEKLQRPKTNHVPSYLTSWAESIILKDEHNIAQTLKEKASKILQQGPDQLTPPEVAVYQKVITEWLDDFIDSKSYRHALFVVYDVFTKTVELLLARNKQWLGERKWLFRALQNSKLPIADQLISALEHFYRTGEKDNLVKAIRTVLSTTNE